MDPDRVAEGSAMTRGDEDQDTDNEEGADDDTCDDCNAAREDEGAGPKRHLPRSEKKKIARLKRKERLKEQRKYKKDKKRQMKSSSDAQNFPQAGDESETGEQRVSKKQRTREIRAKLEEALQIGQRIAIDLSMEDLMSEKECSKLAQQVNRVYGSNRQLDRPAHVYLTGLKKDGLIHRELRTKCAGFDSYKIDVCNESHQDIFSREEVVYLSPDSENILQSVDEDKVYILGGLVDESIQRGVTKSRAESTQIYAAKLPIDEFLVQTEQGTHKKVLAINQVFDVLMKYVECQDWTEALHAGMAKRWGFAAKDRLDCDQAASSPTLNS